MKRIVMSIFAIALTVTPAYTRLTSQQPAQSNCTLTAANAPTIRGIRLGLSLQQLIALFPASSKRKELRDALERARATTSNDTVYLLFEPNTDGGGERFSGVDSVSVGVSKGQVVDFSVLYAGPTWRTANEWIEKLAETLGLPRSQAWVDGPNENPNKVLKCKGVEVEAGIQGGGGSIRIRNTEQDKSMEERKEAGEEKKRRDFKP